MNRVLFMKLAQMLRDIYKKSGDVVVIKQLGYDDWDIRSVIVDNALVVWKLRVKDYVELVLQDSPEVVSWLAGILKTDVATLKLFCKRIMGLLNLASKYPEEYDEVLDNLYEKIITVMLEEYISKVRDYPILDGSLLGKLGLVLK